MQIPFIGPTNRSRSLNFDAQRTVNLYTEASGTGTSKSPMALLGTPGLLLVGSFDGGSIRGMLRLSPTTGLVVAGPNVYFVTLTDGELGLYVDAGYVFEGYVE